MSQKRDRPPSEPWCQYELDDENGEKCPAYDEDHPGVFDNIALKCIDDIDDVMEASDGHCYSKTSLREWYRESSKNRLFHPDHSVKLPASNIPFRDTDVYEMNRGMPFGPRPLDPIIQEFNRVFGTDYDEDYGFEEMDQIKITAENIESASMLDYSPFPIIEVYFTRCDLRAVDRLWNRTFETFTTPFTLLFQECHGPLPRSMCSLHENLDVLVIENMEFDSLPDWIVTLAPHLAGIHIENNPSLVIFPEQILSMSHLRTLQISSTNLRMIPDGIGDLHSLESLHLSDNKLASIPTSIGNILRLEELDLGGNELTSIPDIKSERDRLWISLNDNKLTSLPLSLSRDNVQLDCGNNPLTGWVTAMRKILRKIDRV